MALQGAEGIQGQRGRAGAREGERVYGVSELSEYTPSFRPFALSAYSA